MEDCFARLSLSKEEEEEVGRFVMDRNVNFKAMRNLTYFCSNFIMTLIYESFGLKYHFSKKKKNQNSLHFKLLPKVVRLGHVGDNLANIVVLNSCFTIFEFNCRCCG